jgi:hypothetical protein
MTGKSTYTGDVFHTWHNLRVWNLCQKSSTLTKKETKFSSYNSDGIGCKVIFKEGLPNMWGNAQIFSPYSIWGGR